MLRISGGTGKGNLNTGGVIVAVSLRNKIGGIGFHGVVWNSGIALFTVTTVDHIGTDVNMLVRVVVARIRNLPERSNVIVVPLIVATSDVTILYDASTIAYTILLENSVWKLFFFICWIE